MNRLLTTLAVAALVGLLALPAAAQPLHTLVVRDGQVHVDGRRVPADELPPGLNLDGLQLQLQYSGDDVPVVELGGHYYAIVDGRLVAADEAAGDVAVVFRQGAAPVYRIQTEAEVEGALRELLVRQAEMARQLRSQVEEAVYDVDEQRVMARQMRQQAAQMAEEGRRLEAEQVSAMAEQLRRQAEEAVAVADYMAQLEARQYLQDVQRQDRELYGRLVREHELEARALRLARGAARLPEGEERTELVAELHRHLDAIFELKQENRRDEIRQLEAQLEALRGRLHEREALRARIIEERLRELLQHHR